MRVNRIGFADIICFMKLSEIYNSAQTVISFEVFPPRDDNAAALKEKENRLFDELRVLLGYNPAFLSVTYGAGGSTRDKTLDIVKRIQTELMSTPLPHFTCVGSSKPDVLEYIKTVENLGIENILALRGDPPKDKTDFVPEKDGFCYANELVDFIKSNSGLSVAVAGYPECHQKASCLDDDLLNLKRKVDAGADIVITQIFYDNSFFFSFVEKAKSIGINVPIIPGVMPITSFSQIARMISMCGCSVPEKFQAVLERFKNDDEACKEIGIAYSVEQCKDLLNFGVKGLHFCTLNKAYASKQILDELKLS